MIVFMRDCCFVFSRCFVSTENKFSRIFSGEKVSIFPVTYKNISEILVKEIKGNVTLSQILFELVQSEVKLLK